MKALSNDNNVTDKAKGVRCEVDGTYVHNVPGYLAQNFPKMTLEEYKAEYPDAPLYSKTWKELERRAIEKKKAEAKGSAETVEMAESATVLKHPGAKRRGVEKLEHPKREFGKVFGINNKELTTNAHGKPIMCTVHEDREDEYAALVPAIDKRYIYPVDRLKNVMIAAELNIPALFWGVHGTGKTSLIEQYCARTNRAMLRIQHTIGTEEAHINGHYVVKGGDTQFEPGPLPIAMKYGLVYLADEYDFALPNVTAIYQPVLEGKALVMKEAPPEWRIVEPHPDFRIFATGNTNGSGDDTGLYQGTQVMNAANYSRFGLTDEVPYMEKSLEAMVVASQSRLTEADALLLVEFATNVRSLFKKGEMSATISPRELINAGRLSLVSSIVPDLVRGVELAYSNRLGETDRKAINDYLRTLAG